MTATAIIDSFVKQYNTLAKTALHVEKSNSGVAADHHIKLSGIIAHFLRNHGYLLSEPDVQFLRSETVARVMHALLLRSMELSGFGELALSLSATRHLDQDIANARRRLEEGRDGTEDGIDDMSDPRVKTGGLYEYIPYENIDVTLDDLPGYEKQHTQLVEAYWVIVNKSSSSSSTRTTDSSGGEVDANSIRGEENIESATMYGRRPQTRAGANAILHGPPGTGKTVAARAVAASLKLDFVFVNAENLLSAYRSETEKNLRKLYSKMRLLIKTTKRNVVLLLDEVDGLVKNRNSGDITSGEYSLLTRFLTILEPNDGTDNDGIFSIFTTNKISNLDDAFLRRCIKVFFGKVPEHFRSKLFHTFLDDIIDTTTVPRNAEIANIVEYWVPGDYARFKHDIAKPIQLLTHVKSENLTLSAFYAAHANSNSARSRRIEVDMPKLPYHMIRSEMESFKPVTSKERYIQEYQDEK